MGYFDYDETKKKNSKSLSSFDYIQEQEQVPGEPVPVTPEDPAGSWVKGPELKTQFFDKAAPPTRPLAAVQERPLPQMQAFPDFVQDPTLDNLYQSAGANKDDLRRDVARFSKYLLRPADQKTADLFVTTMGVVGEMGPEAEVKFYKDLVAAIREHEADVKRKQYDEALGIPEAKESEADLIAAQDRATQSRENLKNMFVRLNELPEMHLNGSVIAFVLVSLLLGSKAAAAIFLRKSERGTLKGEIQALIHEVRSQDDRVRQAYADRAASRRAVAQRRFQMLDQANRRNFEVAREGERREYEEGRETERREYQKEVDQRRFDDKIDLMGERQRLMIEAKGDSVNSKPLRDIEKAYSMEHSAANNLRELADSMMNPADVVKFDVKDAKGNVVTKTASREDLLKAAFEAQMRADDIFKSWKAMRQHLGLPPIDVTGEGEEEDAAAGQSEE